MNRRGLLQTFLFLALGFVAAGCLAPAPHPADEAGTPTSMAELDLTLPEDATAEEKVEIQQEQIRKLSRLLDEQRRLNQRGGIDEYRIGPGDVLDISVWKNPDLSRQVFVAPGGSISLPLLNQVPAAGHTPDELREVLIDRFAEYIPAPEVSVIVSQVQSFTVSVIGEANKPGRYQLQGPTTILEALALAGGLTSFASSDDIFVLRPNGKGTTDRLPFDYDKAMSVRGAQLNFYLRAGDIVVVP